MGAELSVRGIPRPREKTRGQMASICPTNRVRSADMGFGTISVTAGDGQTRVLADPRILGPKYLRVQNFQHPEAIKFSEARRMQACGGTCTQMHHADGALIPSFNFNQPESCTLLTRNAIVSINTVQHNTAWCAYRVLNSWYSYSKFVFT